jgi:hypothetical protein
MDFMIQETSAFSGAHFKGAVWEAAEGQGGASPWSGDSRPSLGDCPKDPSGSGHCRVVVLLIYRLITWHHALAVSIRNGLVIRPLRPNRPSTDKWTDLTPLLLFRDAGFAEEDRLGRDRE